MSRSSLWAIDTNFRGFELVEFHNSWLFSPIVWNVLLDKYMQDEIQTPYGYKKGLIGPGGDELHRKLNGIVNNCDSFADRICWEMSNQQVFFTKDKVVIAQAIKDFAQNNTEYDKGDDGISVMSRDHIVERFHEIADAILGLDEQEHQNFVFKNTSVDDNVEYWFEKYSEEDDEYVSASLLELNKTVTEFVFIENGQITNFKSNLEYLTA